MADSPLPRRDFLRRGFAGAVGLGIGTLGWLAARAAPRPATVWQIDPEKCVQCGQCMTDCVLTPSAVKCINQFQMCGYCRLCFGYFQPGVVNLDSGAENQVCPTGALRRRFVEEPYYEYTIDRDLCTGCAKCVKLCAAFGNGSLYLQIQHDLCVQCNECSIAKNCPSGAIRRIPADAPYLLKGGHGGRGGGRGRGRGGEGRGLGRGRGGAGGGGRGRRGQQPGEGEGAP